MTANHDDDWLCRELEAMTPEELLSLDRAMRRRGRPNTKPGQAVHHIDGNPYNNDPANIRIVSIRSNRRQP